MSREQLECALDRMIRHMYIPGMHNEFTIREMKALVIREFENGEECQK